MYRVISTTADGAVGGLEANASAALEKLLSLERQGRKSIVVEDEAGRRISRDELVRRAAEWRGGLDR